MNGWLRDCLYRLRTQTLTGCDSPGVYACAAMHDNEAAVLIAVQKDTSAKLLVDMAGFSSDEGIEADFYLLDEQSDLELVRSEMFYSEQFKSVFEIAKDAVILVQLRKAR
ncbi:MAG: hypothetical protein GX112_16095 [Clostridiaceae bacterium]|nr:hypothetical protein [Clostridiaceae bacterium]